VAGERGGVSRVVDQLVDKILIERNVTLNKAEQYALIEPEDVQGESSENPNEYLRPNARDGNCNCACHGAPSVSEIGEF
jgi:hypothetical protein